MPRPEIYISAPELVPDRPHTHNALGDAIEQAEIFIRLW
jgi:hypothetical protein